ncbi:MAG TPA: hypothetical protein VEY12_05025 [Thermoplasmata archaeon]|nr:hypothetical protein [Thermoplasmata archaeon]
MATSVSDAPSPLSIVALRCRACTAPLPAAGAEDIIKCPSCGTSQRVVDARAFLDQIMLQVNAWVQQAIPLGMQAYTSGTVDPVARYTVFMNYVKPRLTTEYQEYKFNFLNLLSHPLGVLPFMVEKGLPAPNTPANAFLFQAKVSSVAPLAMDDAGKASIAETGGLATAYAYLLNNAALAADLKPERYYLMSKNFTAAAGALKGVPKYAALADRLQALADLNAGLDAATNMKLLDAPAPLDKARAGLESARAKIAKDFDLAIMAQAVDKELALVRASGSIVRSASLDTTGNPAAAMTAMGRLLTLLGSLRDAPYPQWRPRFADLSHSEEILRYVEDIRQAQRGSPTLKVVPGRGSVLFPFWAVDIPYTFQTGALWRAQGVEVTEAMLVAATFPLDANAFSGTDVSAVLTDVFMARERSGFFNDAMKRASGKETSISGGGPVRDAIAKAAMAPAGAVQVVPPLVNGADAAALVQGYLLRVRQVDRTIDKQLRLSSPRVSQLVYAYGTPTGVQANVMPWLGGLAPRSVGDMAAVAAIAL